MISGVSNFANVRGEWSSCNVVFSSIDWPAILSYADWGLIAAGVLVVLVALLRASRPGGSSLWRFSPGREKRVVPEAVLIPMLAFFGAAIIGQTLAGAGLPRTDEGVELGPMRQTLVSNFSFVIGAVVCFLVGRVYVATEDRGFLVGGGRVKREAFLALGFGLSTIALCNIVAIITGMLISLTSPEYEFPKHSVVQAMQDPDCPSMFLPVLWIGTAGLTPVAEEMFFRGLLQNGLSRLFKSRWSGIMATAFVFGLAHGSLPHVIPAMVLFGIIVGIQYERRGSLVGPIITHAIFNAKTLLWVTLGGAGG